MEQSACDTRARKHEREACRMESHLSVGGGASFDESLVDSLQLLIHAQVAGGN